MLIAIQSRDWTLEVFVVVQCERSSRGSAYISFSFLHTTAANDRSAAAAQEGSQRRAPARKGIVSESTRPVQQRTLGRHPTLCFRRIIRARVVSGNRVVVAAAAEQHAKRPISKIDINDAPWRSIRRIAITVDNGRYRCGL